MLNRLQDVFRSFQRHEVRYVVLGGVASVLYGVQTLTPGIRFEDAWSRRKVVTYEGQDFYIVSRDDLIASKRVDGRQIDLEDVRLLELSDQEDNAG